LFLCVLFGLAIEGAALDLFRRHTERSEPPTAAFREAALVCGRHGGKSRVLALIAIFLAAFRDYQPSKMNGPAALVNCGATALQQARMRRRRLSMAHSIEALRRLSRVLLEHSRKLREHADEARTRSAKCREAARRAQLSSDDRLAHVEAVRRRQDRATSN
jgi:hypothetical protein